MVSYDGKMKKAKQKHKENLEKLMAIRKESGALKRAIAETRGKQRTLLKKERKLLQEKAREAEAIAQKSKVAIKKLKRNKAIHETNLGSKEYRKISGRETAGEVGFGRPNYRAF